MNKVIEQNGKYYNKCQVHLLETIKEAKIFSRPLPNIKEYLGILSTPQIASTINSECKGYHLYITSDEEIKEGDWCVCNFQPGIEIRKNIHGVIGSTIGGKEYLKNNCKKIIATTDTSLGQHQGTLEYSLGFNTLPQPSKQFIQKYIEEYNKGSKIEEVLVEYDEFYTGEDNEEEEPIFEYKLKTDSHNTITIKPVKEKLYSQEEVENILFRYAEQHGLTSTKGEIDEFNDWVEKNL